MSAFEDVLGAARTLPTTDRLRVIDALRDAIPPEERAPPHADWIAEAQRRSAEYDAGRMSASPWSDVRARARRQAGLDG